MRQTGLKQCSVLLGLALIVLVTTAITTQAKTVTETRTFRGGSSGVFYKRSEACQQSLKKYEQQRINKACSRVQGKVKIDHVNCDCAQNRADQWQCKKTIKATCTYDSKNMKPAQSSRSNVFGIKKKSSNKITQTQVFSLGSQGMYQIKKRCNMQRAKTVFNAKTGCGNVSGKVKLIKFDCNCEKVGSRHYDCTGVLKASCTFDKGKIKANKELDPITAKNRHGWGILEEMVKE